MHESHVLYVYYVHVCIHHYTHIHMYMDMDGPF